MRQRATQEFRFLRFGREAKGGRPSLRYTSIPASCELVVENWACPAVEGLTPEPLWDVVVEVVHGDTGDLLPTPVGLDAPEPVTWMTFFSRRAVAMDGPRRGIKLISFPPRKTGLTHAEFSRHYAEVHGPLVAGTPIFRESFHNYFQHDVIEGTMAFGPEPVTVCDAISEFWTDSAELAMTAWRSPEYLGPVRADRDTFMEPSHRMKVEEVIAYRQNP